MKLSVFTTITNPHARGDNPDPALKCYSDMADEVVIVNGGIDYDDLEWLPPKCVMIDHFWPQEFNWLFFGEQFQRGYDACTGDWVIKADLDYIFHERDFAAIRKACQDNPEAPALSLWKYQFIQPDRYNLKSRLVIAVNKGKYGDRIKFNGGGDLCQVTLDGKYLSPNDVPEARIPFYNYEKILKTKEQIAHDVGRMERAWKRHFGETQYASDGTDKSGFDRWIKAQIGKYNKPQEKIKLEDHPKYIQETIKNLKEDQFGAGGWGLL